MNTSISPAQPTTNATATQPVDDNSEGGVPLEAEVNDVEPQEINVLHDPDNPNIVKGALFLDIIALRKAVRHYAVITGFEFADLKTDKTRFIEYRECMRHLYSNFMKHYQGDVFTDHLYPAARSYTEGLFKWHMQKIFDVAPDAIEFLEQHHNRLWYRCGFSEKSKCDYLTNNVSESFNA